MAPRRAPADSAAMSTRHPHPSNAGVGYCPQAAAACLRLFRERGYRLAD